MSRDRRSNEPKKSFAAGPLMARRSTAVVIAAVVVGGLAGSGLTVAVSHPSKSASQRSIAALTAADRARDQLEAGQLVDRARAAATALDPVLGALERVTPHLEHVPGSENLRPSAPYGAVPSASELGAWRQIVLDVASRFANPPSAGTEINIATGGFGAAVGNLLAALDALALAARTSDRGPALALAERLRTNGLVTWSVASIELDVVGIEFGFGHVHVRLRDPGGLGLPPDDEPEGSKSS